MVSVIIPVYNIQKYIGKCIESVMNQTYKDLEVILVDDGSTDLSGKICDEYAKKDNRLTVIHTSNQGVSAARNTAIDVMKGQYVIFVDGDDWLAPDMIECLWKGMQETVAQISVCDTYQTDGEYYEIRQFYKYAGDKQEFLENEKYDLVRFTATLWNKLISRDVIKNCRFNTKVRYAEDLEFLVSILENVKKIKIINKPLYYYRYNRQGNVVSSTINPRYMDLLNVNCRVYQKLMREDCKITAAVRLSFALNRTMEFIPINKIFQSRDYLNLIRNIIRNNPEFYDELKTENGIGKRRIITLKIAKRSTVLAVICCRLMKKISGK